MDYKVNEYVVHFREGLSTISEKREMNGVLYYFVRLGGENGEIVYVPVEKADAIIRPVVQKGVVKELIQLFKDVKPEFFNNTKQRRDNFKKRLGSGDIKDLVYLSKQLYFFDNPSSTEVPVKFGPADVEMLRFAKKTLLDELAICYKVKREEIESIITKEIRA